MSWLPLLCRASNGTDAPVLSINERAELERVLEETTEMLEQEEEQEKVLSLWLHHYIYCPSSDWPNLHACYARWCSASRKLLLLHWRALVILSLARHRYVHASKIVFFEIAKRWKRIETRDKRQKIYEAKMASNVFALVNMLLLNCSEFRLGNAFYTTVQYRTVVDNYAVVIFYWGNDFRTTFLLTHCKIWPLVLKLFIT